MADTTLFSVAWLCEAIYIVVLAYALFQFSTSILLSFFIIVNCMVFKIYYTVLPMYLQLMCHPNTCTTNEPTTSTYTLHPQSPLQEVSNRLRITAGAEPAG